MQKNVLKTLFIALLLCLVIPSGYSAAAPLQKVDVVIDGELQISPQSAVVKDGATLVPLRAIFEDLGAKVEWNAKTQTAKGTKGTITVNLVIGSTSATVNGKSVALSTKAQLINGSTMVPLRFVSESLGAKVEFDAKTKTVTITSQEATQGTKIKYIYSQTDFVLMQYTDNSLWAMGNNLGQAGASFSDTPGKLMDDVEKVYTLGSDHEFWVIKNDGSLWEWNDDENASVWTSMKIMDNVAKVAYSYNNMLVIKRDGSLWGWGKNKNGELGDGTTQEIKTPKKMMDNVKDIPAIGTKFTVVLKEDNSVWTWGKNQYGYLGDGTRKDRLEPKKVLENAIYVSSDDARTMAIKKDGSLWAWGDNYTGKIGDGTKNDALSPIKIMDNVKTVSTKYHYAVALKKDGSLWSWGDNLDGRLGHGTKENSLKPKKIMDNVDKISSYNGSYQMAIKVDGSLWAWGSNSYGNIGNGTFNSVYAPVKIMDAVKDIVSHQVATVILKKDQSIWITGRSFYSSNYGDLSVPTTIIPSDFRAK